MTSFNANAKTFSAANALLMAQACEVAYKTEPEAQALMQQLGLPRFRWIDVHGALEDTKAFAAANDQFCILAFQGTADVRQWMTDLHATPVRYAWIFQGAPQIGEIHAGFGHALADAWPTIVAAINEVSPQASAMDNESVDAKRTLWITGHSLGGALAVLAGTAFSTLPGGSIRPVSGIYTFGQPRVGLHNFCQNYDSVGKGLTYRLVNNRDLVPRVPFQGWDYADLGEVIHFDGDGTPKLQSDQWKALLSRTVESFKEAIEIFVNFKMDIGDHSMANYRTLVEGHQDELGALFIPGPSS
jgi:triacylglycerol lipase